MRTFLPAVLLLSTSGCFAIADLDRFEVDDPCASGDPDSTRSLAVAMYNVNAYRDHALEMQIVNSDLSVVSRAIFDGLTTDSRDVPELATVVNAVPPGPHTVRLFTDLNDSGTYDCVAADPSWERPVCNSGLFDFYADMSFADLCDPVTMDVGQDFTIRFMGMTAHTAGTQKLEIAVVDKANGRTVGWYRIPAVPMPDFDVTIPGIVVPGKMYQIDFYVDVSQDGFYQDPPMDHTWRLDEPASTTGIEITFVHNTLFTPVCESFTTECP